MFQVEITPNLPNITGWPDRYQIMVSFAAKYAEGDEVYFVARVRGEVVAMAQVEYDEFYRRYDLKVLVSVFPHAGKFVFGRVLAYAAHYNRKVTLYSLTKSIGFYEGLPVTKRVPPLRLSSALPGAYFIAEAIR